MISSFKVPSIRDIVSSSNRIQQYIHKTPVLTSTSINELIGASLYFKCENYQKVGAFKIRGATNAILQLNDKEKTNGVVTHSSGNHGQAIALAAKWFNSKAYIIMPENSAKPKIEAIRGYGAEIIFCGPTQRDREVTVENLITKTNAHFIHPYDDDRIICGQATAAKEFMEEMPDLDYIIAPIGGGGLISGTILSAQYFNPKTKIIGVEPQEVDDAYQSLKAGVLQKNGTINTLADGLRASLSERTFSIIKNGIHEIITISEAEMIKAMRLVWERMKIIIEPSSATVMAAALKQKEKLKGKKIGLIITGGNVDLEALPFTTHSY